MYSYKLLRKLCCSYFLSHVTQDLSLQRNELDTVSLQQNLSDLPNKLIKKDFDPMELVSMHIVIFRISLTLCIECTISCLSC